MFKKSRSFLAKLLVFALMLALTVTIVKPDEAEAATKNVKVVYTVKQLKKALKAKAASSIIFRTSTVDNVTIPYVKNAKNKDLTIYADEATITNKSRFKSIHLKSVDTFYENANKNNIYWYNSYHGNVVVMPGKSVKTFYFVDYENGVPNVLIRKGAKVANYVFTALDSKQQKDKKTGDITFTFQDQYLPEGNFNKVVFSFDKSGRIIGLTESSSYMDTDSVLKIIYDTNGNITEYTSVYGETTTKETFTYDKNDNLLEIKSTINDGTPYIQRSEYDSNNNRIKTFVIDNDGKSQYNYSFTYDKNNRVISEYSDVTGNKIDYTYDKAGRMLTTKSTDQNGNVSTDLKAEYDKNGMLKTIIYGNDNAINGCDYIYDKNGDNVIQTFFGEDGIIFDATVYGADDSKYVYEDGFVSPLISEVPYMDVDAYKKKGYTVVDTVKELLEAIKPGAKIVMTQGTYNLSLDIDYIFQIEGEKFFENNKYVDLEEVFDGYTVVIHDVDGLVISGGSKYSYNTNIVTDPRYADVLKFVNCKDITLNSITIGHTESSECSGDVLKFDNTKNVKLYNMDLYGCGVFGISTDNKSANISVYNSKIHDCSYGPVCFENSTGKMTFTLCAFINSMAGGYADVSDKNFKLTFDRCVFGGGESNSWYFLDYATKKNCVFSEITQYPEYSD